MDCCPYTVLVVTWNGDGLLEDCLRSIAENVPRTPPCVVVDNAASESTRRLCARFGFVRYVAAPSNLGFAGGNNLGLPLCKTRYVCLLNNDTVVKADSFSPLADFLDRNPQAGAVQGTMVLPRCGGTLDDCGTTLSWYGTQRQRVFSKPDPGDLAPVKVFSAKGAFMMVRMSAIAAAGGFLFHGHFGSYYEETDFCHRVWLSGSEVWFVPTPPVEHMLGATSSKFDNAAIWRRYVANIFFSYRANFTLEGKLRIMLPFAAVCAAWTLFNLLTGNFSRFAAMLGVPFVNMRRRKELRAAMAAVRAFRKLSDRRFLRIAMERRQRRGRRCTLILDFPG